MRLNVCDTETFLQLFINRFCKEYLSALLERSNEKKKESNDPNVYLDVGDIVLLKDTHKSRLLWQKGKITKFLDRHGNKIRVVYYFSDISVFWNLSSPTIWTTEILRILVTKNIQSKVLSILPLLHCFGWLKTSVQFIQRTILKKTGKIYILRGFK